MITRIAVPDDAAAIAAIHVRSWQEAYRGLLPQDYLSSLDPARRTEGWRDSLAAQNPPADAAVVLPADDQLVGFAHVCPSRDEDEPSDKVGELVSIYLLPEAWGRGLGQYLMSHALRLLTDAGNRSATLWVMEGNTRAIRFYGANGWSPDGAGKQLTIGQTPVRAARYRIAL